METATQETIEMQARLLAYRAARLQMEYEAREVEAEDAYREGVKLIGPNAFEILYSSAYDDLEDRDTVK